MEKKEKILETIKKLFSFNKDNATEAEVSNAIRKAKMLMAKYNLTTTQVDDHKSKHEKPKFEIDKKEGDKKASFSRMEKQLMRVCDNLFEVQHFFDKYYYDHDRRKVLTQLIFVGVPQEALLAGEVFKVLRRTIWRMGQKQYGKGWGLEQRSYGEGIADELNWRSAEESPEIKNSSLALVIRSKEDEVNSFMGGLNLTSLKGRSNAGVSVDSYDHGRSDGKKISLDFRNTVK